MLYFQQLVRSPVFKAGSLNVFPESLLPHHAPLAQYVPLFLLSTVLERSLLARLKLMQLHASKPPVPLVALLVEKPVLLLQLSRVKEFLLAQ